MNILFIYPKMFHPYPGGIERVSELLCREFLRRGHNVFCLHVRDEGHWDDSFPAPIFYFPCPIEEVEQNGLFYQTFLQEHQIDIVINQDPLAYHNLYNFSKVFQEVHTISVIHNYPLGIYDHIFELVMWAKGEKTLKGAIKRIARIIKVPIIKYKFRQTLKNSYADILAHTDLLCLLSLKFIPDMKRVYSNSLDKVIAIGNPNTYPVQKELSSLKKKQILYVGRVEWYQKRVGRLIDIWKHLYKDYPDWELIIVGDGPIRKELEQKSSGMQRIIFAGYQEPEPYYRSASILCLTSDFEGWGMVLTEAMTFGTIPVVFNSFAAVTDIIDDGRNGILVPPFSCKRFAQEMKVLMGDEELRVQMSKDCVQSVKRFDIQNVADQWETTFKRLKAENNQ